MIVEATSTDEAAEKLNALPLVRSGFLKPPMIVPLKPYSGFAPAPDRQSLRGSPIMRSRRRKTTQSFAPLHGRTPGGSRHCHARERPLAMGG
jgi:hypothetical protein